MSERRTNDVPHRIVCAATGLAIGAGLMVAASATRQAWMPVARAAAVVVQVPYKPTRLICQPIKTPAVRRAELKILLADLYEPVMATDVHTAFAARSAGTVELLPLTNLECFEPDWITQKFPADTYYQRPAKP